MQPGIVHYVRTLAASQFRAALAQNAIATLDLDPAIQGVSLGPHAACHVVGVQILSAEQLDWGVYLYRKNTYNVATIDSNFLAGYWEFVASTARRIAATGPYIYFDASSPQIPYWDEDRLGQIHMGLVNRSAAGKSADDAGAISVRLFLQLGIGGS